MIVLDTIFRLGLNETAINLNEISKWDKASVREVINAHGLSLLTGIRPYNVTRGAKGREIDTEAYRALICETQRALDNNRRRIVENECLYNISQKDLAFNIRDIYNNIRRAV